MMGQRGLTNIEKATKRIIVCFIGTKVEKAHGCEHDNCHKEDNEVFFWTYQAKDWYIWTQEAFFILFMVFNAGFPTNFIKRKKRPFAGYRHSGINTIYLPIRYPCLKLFRIGGKDTA